MSHLKVCKQLGKKSYDSYTHCHSISPGSDECLATNRGCSQICSNENNGNFECSCFDGYDLSMRDQHSCNGKE